MVVIVGAIVMFPNVLLLIGSGFAFTKAFDSMWLGNLVGITTSFIGASTGALIVF